eukprot:scaffold16570_cov124-Amphora_coffeaeformis.AAC.1
MVMEIGVMIYFPVVIKIGAKTVVVPVVVAVAYHPGKDRSVVPAVAALVVVAAKGARVHVDDRGNCCCRSGADLVVVVVVEVVGRVALALVVVFFVNIDVAVVAFFVHFVADLADFVAAEAVPNAVTLPMEVNANPIAVAVPTRPTSLL